MRVRLEARRSGSPAALAAILLSLGAPEAVAAAEPGAAASAGSGAAAGEPALKRGLRVFLDDAGAVYSAPARWRWKGWTVFSAIVAGSALVVTRDDEIRREVLDSDAPDRERAGRSILRLGDPEIGALLPWISYAAAAGAGSARFKQTSLVAFEAWVLSAAATAVLKGATGRLGPADDRENNFFKGGDLFPSGHTSRTFAIAAAFADRHGKRAAWIGYPVAGLVGLAMIDTDVHWASDVAAGAALGIAVGRAVAKRHPPAPAEKSVADGRAAGAQARRGGDGGAIRGRAVEWEIRAVRGGALVALLF